MEIPDRARGDKDSTNWRLRFIQDKTIIYNVDLTQARQKILR